MQSSKRLQPSPLARAAPAALTCLTSLVLRTGCGCSCAERELGKWGGVGWVVADMAVKI